jgi:hypothetical protein
MEFAKDNTKKEKKSDPYENVRRDVPIKPGITIMSEKDYKRSRKKQEIFKEIEEWRDEIATLGVEI